MADKTAFSKILRKLRENRKISQKNVSKDLGISQALLSHYEKGVRECGLSFLIKASKYYGVTTDYLLGLTAAGEDNSRDCICINSDDDKSNKTKEKQDKKKGRENKSAVLYKNLIINATDYIFDNMKDTENKRAAQISGEYMILSIYSLYKHLTDESGEKLSSYEEVEAAKSKLILELKKNKQNFENSHTNHLSNEYIDFLLTNGNSIILKINSI